MYPYYSNINRPNIINYYNSINQNVKFMKKRLLFMLLTLLCFIGGAKAQNELTVYDGTATNSYVPVYGFYADAYLKGEFVIPATELTSMSGGTVSKMTFYLQTPAEAAWTGTFQVFLKEVTETTLSAYSGTEGATIVYEGTLDATGSTMEINFSTNYAYSGGNLLVGIYQTENGNYKSASFYGETVNGASVQGHSYKSLGEVTTNQRNFIPKTTFTYTGGSAVYNKPKNVIVSSFSDQTATISWTAPSSDVTGYVYQYKEAEDPDDYWSTEASTTATSVTLTGLTEGTTYNFRVKAKYGSNESAFVTVDFNTDFCSEVDQCLITLELTDSYGDGWSGNKIQVVDNETGIVLGTYTLASGSDGSFSLAVCPGRLLNFVWVAGNFGSECSFVIKDLNEDVLLSHDAGTAPTAGVLGSYLVDCTTTTARMPSGLAASEIGPKSVKLSWTENGPATAWVVAYKTAAATDFIEVDAATNPFTLTNLTPETAYTVKVRPVSADGAIKWSNAINFTTLIATPTPTDLTASEISYNSAKLSWAGFANSYDVRYAPLSSYSSSWLQYDNGTYSGGIGSGSAATRTWGVMYPGSQVTGNTLSKVSIYETSDYNTADITINVYSGGDDAPGTLLYTETVTPEAANAFHEVTLAELVDITPGENLWITLTEYGTYVMTYCQPESVEPNDQWVESGGWYNIGALSSSLAGDCWMIRGFMENIDLSSVSWTETSTTESTYQLTGLTTETSYFAQVRGDFGADGVSGWATTVFTTTGLNPVPFDVNVDASYNSATISWTGFSDSYKLSYRKALKENPTFFESFDSGLPDTWTTVDADGDGNNWLALSDVPTVYPAYDDVRHWAHHGNNAVTSPSYANSVGSFNSNQYLITPKVDLGGTLTFYATSKYGDEDSYEVLLSTASNNIEDFTVTLQSMKEASYDTWDRVNIDLSAYEGQQGYIAIHHVSSDKYFLVIDDFGIYEGTSSSGAWVETNTTEKSITLTGLTADTDYDYTITGIKAGQPNAETDIASFSTESGALITMNEHGIMTYASSYRLDFSSVSDLKAYAATDITNDNLTMTTVNVAPAAAGLMLKGTADATFFVPATTEDADDLSDNKLVGLLVATNVPQVDGDGNVTYILAKKEGVINWYQLAETNYTLKANSAYLKLTSAEVANIVAGARGLGMIFDDGTTAIQALQGAAMETENGAWYTLQGLRLDKQPTTKGIYIHNGRKVVIK